MSRRGVVRALALASVALPGLWLSTSITFAQEGVTEGQGYLVAKAACGIGEHTESGLQGETSMWERFSGDSMTHYNCNLEVVGNYRGPEFEGAYSQDGPAFYDHCAYYGTDRVEETMRYHGVTVIDASDPANPVPTAHLDDTPAALAMHEAMWVSEDRALLVLAENNGENVAVYDISDCAHPVLTGQVDLEGSIGHMSTLSPDGMTYWVTQTGSNRMFTYVVDISDPSNPVMLPTAEFPEEGWFHQVMINPPDFPEPGTEGGIWMYGGQRSGDKQEALVIVDVSDYQERSPTPEAPVVSFIALPEGIPEPMVPMIIDGQPYIIATDEAGGASGYGSWADACEAGGASFGSPTLVDVSDHNNPSVAAKLWLEVHHPANCEPLRTTTPPDVPGDTPGTNLPDASGTTNYSIERCVPYPSNLDAKIMACSGQNLGLRVWDIRDPLHVREVAYFKPGAPRTSFLPASGSWALGVDRTVDKIAGWAHWVVEETEDGPEVQLWTVSDGNGFFALRFTDHFKAIYPDLWEEVFGG